MRSGTIDDVILAGGLVPLLYRHLPGFSDPGLSPCATRDVDLTIENRLPVRDKSVRAALEGAGLHVVEVPGIGRQIAQQLARACPYENPGRPLAGAPDSQKEGHPVRKNWTGLAIASTALEEPIDIDAVVAIVHGKRAENRVPRSLSGNYP